MNKTKIEWVKNPDGTQGYSWNPIKGLCPAGCWYCYSKGFYRRFHPEILTPFLDRSEFGQGKSRKSKGIFVCSTFDLFHPITETLLLDKIITKEVSTWRDAIFYAIEHTPWHRFYILTKFPQNIDRPMPENVWLGVSLTGEEDEIDAKRFYALYDQKSKVKFISFEPLLDEIDYEILSNLYSVNWIVIGQLTGHGRKHIPEIEWIDAILDYTDHYKIPVFLKDNLREIWGKPLIQEFPE